MDPFTVGLIIGASIYIITKIIGSDVDTVCDEKYMKIASKFQFRERMYKGALRDDNMETLNKLYYGVSGIGDLSRFRHNDVIEHADYGRTMKFVSATFKSGLCMYKIIIIEVINLEVSDVAKIHSTYEHLAYNGSEDKFVIGKSVCSSDLSAKEMEDLTREVFSKIKGLAY